MHSDALLARETDWRQIVRLYDQLMSVAPSQVVALNRAVAVAEVDGPAAALHLVDALALDTSHLFHAIRADLLRRLDRKAEAAAAYAEAIACCLNVSERDFLRRQSQTTGARLTGVHPRPMYGIFVAITVRNWTFTSSGRPAM